MFDEKLDQIRALKRRGTALRNREMYSRALSTFDTAIDECKTLENQPEIKPGELEEVRLEHADAYGMKGGTYRRMDEPGKALEEYKKGRELEREYRKSTYNASNVITLVVSQGQASPTDDDVQEDLKEVIGDLEKTTQSARADEWWAWSDLGQFLLLADNVEKAKSAYSRALNTGPRTDEVKRHVQILKELENGTRSRVPGVAKNITSIINQLGRHFD